MPAIDAEEVRGRIDGFQISGSPFVQIKTYTDINNADNSSHVSQTAWSQKVCTHTFRLAEAFGSKVKGTPKLSCKKSGGGGGGGGGSCGKANTPHKPHMHHE